MLKQGPTLRAFISNQLSPSSTSEKHVVFVSKSSFESADKNCEADDVEDHGSAIKVAENRLEETYDHGE